MLVLNIILLGISVDALDGECILEQLLFSRCNRMIMGMSIDLTHEYIIIDTSQSLVL
jgi:hypothetical protein